MKGNTMADIVFSAVDKDPYRYHPHAPENYPNVSTGYNVVAEYNGKFYMYHEFPSGGSRVRQCASRDEAISECLEAIEFNRKFWDEMVAWKENGDRTDNDRPVIRVSGDHYVIEPPVNYRNGAGYGGSLFRFRMLATGEIIESRNVWHQGTIPDDYRDRLPDNAEFYEPESKNPKHDEFNKLLSSYDVIQDW